MTNTKDVQSATDPRTQADGKRIIIKAQLAIRSLVCLCLEGNVAKE